MRIDFSRAVLRFRVAASEPDEVAAPPIHPHPLPETSLLQVVLPDGATDAEVTVPIPVEQSFEKK